MSTHDDLVWMPDMVTPADVISPAPDHQRLEILGAMIPVRAFEDPLTALAREGNRLPGIQILSTGQAAAVAAVLALRTEDVLVSNHRNRLPSSAQPAKGLSRSLRS